MTVNKLIKKLSSLNEKNREKEIVVQCSNGLLVEPSIKFILKDKFSVLNLSSDNIDKVILTIGF